MKTKTVHMCRKSWVLSPGRAAFWLEKKILVIADPHFGKAAAFRAHGIPIPGGTTRDDLKRLADLIIQFRPEELIILGDLMHGRAGNTPGLRLKIKAWRDRFSNLPLRLIQGNHDRRSGHPPREFRIDRIQEEMEVAPFLFTHEPRASDGHYVIAGHVHPSVRLVSPGRHRETLPCFCFGRDRAILPAFGSFTGTQTIQPLEDDRLFLLAGDEIVAITERIGRDLKKIQ
jgi:DNA ligase-associated metallophosphoesterase